MSLPSTSPPLPHTSHVVCVRMFLFIAVLFVHLFVTFRCCIEATVSLATNTYCMIDAIAPCATRTMGPRSNLAVCVNRAIDDRPGIQQEAICYQWFKQRLILSVSNPSISQQSQIKEDTVEPSVCAREFNLKAYAAITDPMIRPGWASNPDSPITLARQHVLRRYQQRHRGRLT